jgi:hypothetical protein
MARFAKTFAVLMAMMMTVTMVVGASSLGAQPLLLSSQTQGPKIPAGCHEHDNQAPAPRRASYECCLIGHDTAVPQPVQNAEPPLHNIQMELPSETPRTSVATSLEDLCVSSGDPPGVTALRI